MRSPRSFTLHKIDWVAIATVLILSLALLLLLLGGVWCTRDRCWLDTRPKVRDFSWANRTVRAQDRAFILQFDRPMAKETVEDNLALILPDQVTIADPLPGKISWSGRRLAYTLDFPAPYGNQYRLELKNAREQFQGNDQLGQTIRPYSAEFHTPDRVIAYIGTERGERGRLVLFNFTKQQKTVLTPDTLQVTAFEPYADSHAIVFSAVEKTQTRGLLEQKLYRVMTGIAPETEPQQGQVELVLDNTDYQILKFDLAANGEFIVAQRVNRERPTEVGLWLMREGKEPIALENPPGGVFQIAPDNEIIVSAQGEGIALLSLEPGAEPLDFLAQFGMVLTFSPDGRYAAMVDFNRDNPDLLYTRSLYVVNNQRVAEKVVDLEGSITSCQFTPDSAQLYCLLSERLDGEEYSEEPYLALVDRDREAVTPLTRMPPGLEVYWHLAPDGLALVFDQVTVDPELRTETVLKTDAGDAIATGKLWLLIPASTPDAPPTLEELPFAGIRPQWLP